MVGLGGIFAATSGAASHGVITSAVGERATGDIVVEGVMYCDLREQQPWDRESGLSPECAGQETLASAFVFVNSYGERCGKPGGFLGADLDRSYRPSTTSYEFQVTDTIDLASEGKPTVACLKQSEVTSHPNRECAEFFHPSLCAEEYGEEWSLMATAPIRWIGPPPRIPTIGGFQSRKFMVTALEYRLGSSFTHGYNRAGPKVKCRERLGPSRMGCKINFSLGDSNFEGKGTIRLGRCEPAICWYSSFRIRRTNLYCVYVHERSRRQCSKLITDKEHDYLY